MFAKGRPCTVCGEKTSKYLFKDKKLSIPICSFECEHDYMGNLSRKDEERILSHFDHKIERTKSYEKTGWAVAGLGLVLVAAGFFVKSADMFIAGIFPMTLGAFSTSHFGDRMKKLMKMRKRIAI